MRRFIAISVLAIAVSTSSAGAAGLELPSREIARGKIVKWVKRLAGVVTGDGLSEPKP